MSLVLKKEGANAKARYMLAGQDSSSLSRTPSAPSEEQTSWVIALIASTQLVLVRFVLTKLCLCRSRYRCHGFLGLPRCPSKTTMDLCATRYFVSMRGNPCSEKSSGLGKAVSTILLHSRAVPSWI